MAMSAYYLKGVQTKNVELMEIFRGIMPFLSIVILSMVLMYLFQVSHCGYPTHYLQINFPWKILQQPRLMT